MRKPVAISSAARTAPPYSGRRVDAPAQLVCLALVLAVIALAARIASIW
jgi:hypothetical protein